MIVRCNDHERHLFDSSEVHAFMKRSGLHPAFADATQADKVFFAVESLRHQCTDRDRDLCPGVTNHGKRIIAAPASMLRISCCAAPSEASNNPTQDRQIRSKIFLEWHRHIACKFLKAG